MSDHEVLDVDVLFVGAGPAGLGGAIRLAVSISNAPAPKLMAVRAHNHPDSLFDPQLC